MSLTNNWSLARLHYARSYAASPHISWINHTTSLYFWTMHKSSYTVAIVNFFKPFVKNRSYQLWRNLRQHTLPVKVIKRTQKLLKHDKNCQRICPSRKTLSAKPSNPDICGLEFASQYMRFAWFIIVLFFCRMQMANGCRIIFVLFIDIVCFAVINSKHGAVGK